MGWSDYDSQVAYNLRRIRYNAGFRINMVGGVRYEFTEKISALAEVGCGVIGVPSWSARVGAMYRFGK